MSLVGSAVVGSYTAAYNHRHVQAVLCIIESLIFLHKM